MARLFVEKFWVCLPLFPDELSWRKALEHLQFSGMVAGVDEAVEVSAQLLVIVMVVAFRAVQVSTESEFKPRVFEF